MPAERIAGGRVGPSGAWAIKATDASRNVIVRSIATWMVPPTVGL